MIEQIGPVVLTSDEIVGPGGFTVNGKPNTFGGTPVVIEFTIRSLRQAKQVYSYINNPDRQQEIGGAYGVLGLLITSTNLPNKKGWYVFEDCTYKLERLNLVATETDNWVTVMINAVFFGTSKVPILAMTHSEKTDDFGVSGVPLTPGIFPFTGLDYGQFSGSVSRAAIDPTTPNVALYSGIPTRARLRGEYNASPLHHPRVVDLDGITYYGPSEARVLTNFLAVTPANSIGLKLETATVRATLVTATHFTIEVAAAAGPAWLNIGELRVYEPSLDEQLHLSSLQILDDCIIGEFGIGVGRTFKLMLRTGDYGVRILNYEYDRFIDTPAVLADNGATNYYYETSTVIGGGRRFVALVKTSPSEDPANGNIVIGPTHEAFFGWEPGSATGLNTAASQAAQLLYDRSVTLTIE